MTAILARAMMVLAARCLGRTRRQWAHAMHIEFEAAATEGKQLSFAFGCLVAACRELPAQDEGRLALAKHAVALGFLVPMAAIQFLYAGGFSFSADGYGPLDPARPQNPYLSSAQLAAVPSLLFLWLVLGAAHLRLAWVLLEQDWRRVFSISAVIVAGTATLAIYMGVLFLEDARLALHSVATAVELTAIFAAAQWHRRMLPSALGEELPKRP